jgi:Alginate export
MERKLSDSMNINAYYANFTQADVHFPNAAGDERRDILDVRATGTAKHFDWDLEAMNQTGRIGTRAIEAWGFGSLAGYTFADVNWTPRFGIQVDAASGDGKSPGHPFGTFNPLFPNGYYLTLAGYSGYVNFIHVKPSLTLHSSSSLKITLAAAAQWRQNTARCLHPARHPGSEHRRPARRLYRQLRPASARLDHRPRNFICNRGCAL